MGSRRWQMASHTPAPWALIEFGGPQIGNPETGEAVCTMWGSDYFDRETGKQDPFRANIALVAAAPDLLNAAVRLIEVFKLTKLTTAERIICGVSDAGLRTEGTAAMDALTAAANKALAA